MTSRTLGLLLVMTLLACHRRDVRPPAPNQRSAAPLAPPTSSPVAPAPSPAPELRCPDGMVLVPGATFTMGHRYEREAMPPHQVTLSSFCLDRTEVTAADYARCSAEACQRPDVERDAYEGEGCAKSELHPAHPRNCVTWFQAQAYCAFRGGNLPTEAQWELAARGPEGRPFPWGYEPRDPSRAEYGEEELDDPHVPLVAPLRTFPVGSHPAGRSPLGLEDLSGNVAEWVADWYASYSPEQQRDPTGPSTGTEKVTRGGASERLRARSLSGYMPEPFAPETRAPFIGFRCAALPP